MLILKMSRDETVGSAGERVIGAGVGTLVGLAALAVTDLSPAASIGAVMLVMGALSAWKPDWRYGIVAAAGIAVESDLGFLETAQARGLAILFGAGAGTLVGLLVWPESARARTARHLRVALNACRELLTDAVSATVEGGDPDLGRLHSRFADAIGSAHQAAASIRIGRGHAKPYRMLVHSAERLWHALIIIDRVSNSGAEALRLADATSSHVDALNAAACDALDCAARLERVPEELLARLDDERSRAIQSCRSENEDERVERAALVFGLGEVGRNLREIDDAICAIRKAG